jgi:DNA polymerase (family 10)
MTSNREIRQLFSLYAELLLLHQVDERLSGWLSGAAYRLRNISEEVSGFSPSELAEHFRPPIVELIQELNKKGTLSTLDELIQLTPPGLFEMMRIKGLGGKKLSTIWRTAKIDSLEALLTAAKEGTLAEIPGFGKKTEENIIAAIENYHAGKNRFHFADVADTADQLVDALKKKLDTKLVSTCGETRRMATTVSAIELIVGIPAKNMVAAQLRKFIIIDQQNENTSYAHTLDEIPVIIYHAEQKRFYLELFERTGSDLHVQKVLERVEGNISHYKTEQAIYAQAKLSYIVPEMREDNAEWQQNINSKDLIQTNDIKGVVHNHTDWSDGVDSLESFVTACKKQGYEYVVISDHSKNAHYAGGLKEEKLLRQLEVINSLNKKMAPFRIFSSIECDILVSGELDYDSSILQQLDMVIISVHQLLKMDEQKATKRLVKAIENPYTTILGHMTGRQLLIRPGYPVDFKKVIDACAANNVVIEINANPYRLDMDWSHIPYAMEKGVMISIDPDAHSISEIENIRWGVCAARKGGLTRAMTWNALPLSEIKQWLKDKRSRMV